ncbi:hypothetical protein ACFQVD_00870 [Streptosporangium amethystogenes subsp. fukuiense]|uniref:DUF2637 domain-containing protein n=1 Tax=Streptosporangium amethystogenes subsp. fukuiense TaxID=698418 RepID=A0ABW2SQT2_9ACTN
MSVTSILPARIEREKGIAVAVGLLAALCPNIIGQWHLAVAIGWNPYLAAALPVASELYAAMAARVWAATPKHYRAQKKAAAWNMAVGILLSFALNGLAEAVAFGAIQVALWLVLVVAAVPTLCVAVLLHMAMSGTVEQEDETGAVYTSPADEPVADKPPALPPAIEVPQEDKPVKPRGTVRVSPANIAKARDFLERSADPAKITGTDLETVLPRLGARSRREALDKARADMAAHRPVQDALELIPALV